jgi:hypothetical protein
MSNNHPGEKSAEERKKDRTGANVELYVSQCRYIAGSGYAGVSRRSSHGGA